MGGCIARASDDGVVEEICGGGDMVWVVAMAVVVVLVPVLVVLVVMAVAWLVVARRPC